MGTKPTINPLLNNKVVQRAAELCHEQNAFDRKSFNKNYDAAIREVGYTPAYFKNVMRQIGPQGDF